MGRGLLLGYAALSRRLRRNGLAKHPRLHGRARHSHHRYAHAIPGFPLATPKGPVLRWARAHVFANRSARPRQRSRIYVRRDRVPVFRIEHQHPSAPLPARADRLGPVAEHLDVPCAPRGGPTESAAKMNRRYLLGGLLILPASGIVAAEPCVSTSPLAQPDPEDSDRRRRRAAMIRLAPSGPVTARDDGQIIENLDIDAGFADGVTVGRRDVMVRNCR